jgi:hypothetical protein
MYVKFIQNISLKTSCYETTWKLAGYRWEQSTKMDIKGIGSAFVDWMLSGLVM